MAGPCAASLSVTRLPPRPDSYRHTHSDAKRAAARDFSVPQVNLRRPASALVECQGQSSTEPTGRRSYRTGFSKRVRSYERTCVPAWQTQTTNSGHGLPDGHLHGACLPPWPHWDVSERRWLYPESRPQRANFVMPPRPRGAIGRPRAAPGRPPMAVGGMDGPEGARTDLPAQERG